MSKELPVFYFEMLFGVCFQLKMHGECAKRINMILLHLYRECSEG